MEAYCLGAGSDMEKDLIRRGRIRFLEDGSYELFSQEARSGKGQIAHKGDYFKLVETDTGSYPYPNRKEFFEKNHRLIEGTENLYEQVSRPLFFWMAEDPIEKPVSFLLESGRLVINPDDEEAYFSARLWGADLSAAKDAAIVFYRIETDQTGDIVDVDFFFVSKKDFEMTYTIEKPEPIR